MNWKHSVARRDDSDALYITDVSLHDIKMSTNSTKKKIQQLNVVSAVKGLMFLFQVNSFFFQFNMRKQFLDQKNQTFLIWFYLP